MAEMSTQLLMDITLTPCPYPSVYHRDQCSALHCSLCFQRSAVKCEITTIYLFADDITIYCIKRTADEAVAQLDKALDGLYDWCILNRLTPHPEKSEAILICKTRATGPVAPIHIGTDAIVWVNKSRSLGITVDDKLLGAAYVGSQKEFRKEARPS